MDRKLNTKFSWKMTSCAFRGKFNLRLPSLPGEALVTANFSECRSHFTLQGKFYSTKIPVIPCLYYKETGYFLIQELAVAVKGNVGKKQPLYTFAPSW